MATKYYKPEEIHGMPITFEYSDGVVWAFAPAITSDYLGYGKTKKDAMKSIKAYIDALFESRHNIKTPSKAPEKRRGKKPMKIYCLYKDKYMSGWGDAERGSYVISDAPVDRPEFKLLGEANSVQEFTFRSGAGRHFELWTGVKRSNGRTRPAKSAILKWKSGRLYL